MKLHGKRVDLVTLKQEATTAGVVVGDLGTVGLDPAGLPDALMTWDANGTTIDVPPTMQPVVDAHTPPPLMGDFTRVAEVSALTQTRDDVAREVFRFPCDIRRRYRAELVISGVDQANFVSRDMEGRFVWKRVTGNVIMVGITIVSTLGEAASSSWAPNALPDGTDIVFTVKGAAGRTIDWKLAGRVEVYAPAGLT